MRADAFLRQVAAAYCDIEDKEPCLRMEDICFVFPNRRAGLFFRKELARMRRRTSFAPDILGINDLFFRSSPLRQADPVDMLFTLYRVYRKNVDDDMTFDRFVSFGNMLLADGHAEHLTEARALSTRAYSGTADRILKAGFQP